MTDNMEAAREAACLLQAMSVAEKAWKEKPAQDCEHPYDLFLRGVTTGCNAAQLKPCVWTPVSEGLPTEHGWYLVSVREHNDLGTFDYTDIVSWGNRAEVGDTWFVQSDKVTVMAWQSRPEPYNCGGKVEEASDDGKD